MAVSSEVRTSLRRSMILRSPFMRLSVSRRGEGHGLGGAAGRTGSLAGHVEDDLAQRVLAAAAVAANAAALQLFQASGAGADRVADVTLRSSPADADDHGFPIPIETESQSLRT